MTKEFVISSLSLLCKEHTISETSAYKVKLLQDFWLTIKEYKQEFSYQKWFAIILTFAFLEPI